MRLTWPTMKSTKPTTFQLSTPSLFWFIYAISPVMNISSTTTAPPTPMNRMAAIEHDYALPCTGAVPARRPCAPTCAACALVPSPPTTEAAEQQRPCVNTKTTMVASSLFRFITPLRLSLLPPFVQHW